MDSLIVTEEGDCLNLDININKSKFNELVSGLVDRCVKILKEALLGAELTN